MSPRGTFNRLEEERNQRGEFYTWTFVLFTLPVSMAVCWALDVWVWLERIHAKYLRKRP